MWHIFSRLLLGLGFVIILTGTANAGKKVKLPHNTGKVLHDTKSDSDPMKEKFELKEPVRLTCSGTMRRKTKGHRLDPEKWEGNVLIMDGRVAVFPIPATTIVPCTYIEKAANGKAGCRLNSVYHDRIFGGSTFHLSEDEKAGRSWTFYKMHHLQLNRYTGTIQSHAVEFKQDSSVFVKGVCIVGKQLF